MGPVGETGQGASVTPECLGTAVTERTTGAVRPAATAVGETGQGGKQAALEIPARLAATSRQS